MSTLVEVLREARLGRVRLLDLMAPSQCHGLDNVCDIMLVMNDRIPNSSKSDHTNDKHEARRGGMRACHVARPYTTTYIMTHPCEDAAPGADKGRALLAIVLRHVPNTRTATRNGLVLA